MDTFLGLSGQLLASGYLKFYSAGTTTPKDVFGEKALSTNNGSTITLDASGRPDDDVWGSGSYFVEIYDADDVKQGEADNVEIPGGEATALPTLVAGEFLTNDGSVMSWDGILQVPDPTGSANKILVTDGTTVSWGDRPADGDAGTANVTQTSTEITVEDMALVTGSATGTSVGGRTQSVAVTFATAFTSTPVWIGIQVTSSSLSSFGNMPSWSIATSSTTGFTVKFTMGEMDDSQAGFDFNAGVAFKYVAMGVRTA
jgi:hypothetical protein